MENNYLTFKCRTPSSLFEQMNPFQKIEVTATTKDGESIKTVYNNEPSEEFPDYQRIKREMDNCGRKIFEETVFNQQPDPKIAYRKIFEDNTKNDLDARKRLRNKIKRVEQNRGK